MSSLPLSQAAFFVRASPALVLTFQRKVTTYPDSIDNVGVDNLTDALQTRIESKPGMEGLVYYTLPDTTEADTERVVRALLAQGAWFNFFGSDVSSFENNGAGLASPAQAAFAFYDDDDSDSTDAIMVTSLHTMADGNEVDEDIQPQWFKGLDDPFAPFSFEDQGYGTWRVEQRLAGDFSREDAVTYLTSLGFVHDPSILDFVR